MDLNRSNKMLYGGGHMFFLKTILDTYEYVATLKTTLYNVLFGVHRNGPC